MGKLLLHSAAICVSSGDFLKPYTTFQEYEVVGYGPCDDADGQPYESWYGWDPDLEYSSGNISTCKCGTCAAACDQYTACVGYSYYCTPAGVRSTGGGASILFDKGKVPTAQPPAGFRTYGSWGSPTTGDYYKGTGPINGGRVANVSSPSPSPSLGGWYCLRKA